MRHPDPICVHPDVAVKVWDNGRDPETGYRDTGVAVTCRDCGEQFGEAEYRQDLAERERDRNPRPGDLYTQFDNRLVVVDATEEDVYYVCRSGDFIGPLRSVPLHRFRFFLHQGLITRLRGGQS
jgi:hypothetical protein